jgi:hypothetical protein
MRIFLHKSRRNPPPPQAVFRAIRRRAGLGFGQGFIHGAGKYKPGGPCLQTWPRRSGPFQLFLPGGGDEGGMIIRFFIRGATAGGGGLQTCFTRASLQFFTTMVTILFLGETYFR